jgi:hypothetical protein
MVLVKYRLPNNGDELLTDCFGIASRTISLFSEPAIVMQRFSVVSVTG